MHRSMYTNKIFCTGSVPAINFLLAKHRAPCTVLRARGPSVSWRVQLQLEGLHKIKKSAVFSISKMYKLICLDLDGTTLNSHHELSSETITVLQTIASKSDAKISIVTGRSALSSIKYAMQLQLNKIQGDTYIICYNGSTCIKIDREYNGNNHSIIFSNPISRENARLLVDISLKLGLVLQYYNVENGEMYAVPSKVEHYPLLNRYADLVGQKHTFLSNYDEVLAKCESPKILIMTDDADGLIDYCHKYLTPNIFHIIRVRYIIPDTFLSRK